MPGIVSGYHAVLAVKALRCSHKVLRYSPESLREPMTAPLRREGLTPEGNPALVIWSRAMNSTRPLG